VNAVGGVDNDNNPLLVNCGYWQNTVILITWDDWGGFYDDVDPDPNGTGYPNSGNNAVQYVYGFRVPLLVASAYAEQGYTSNIPHDFGSILSFIEHSFGITTTINGSTYPYADSFAPDLAFDPYALSDFFGTQQQPFVWIQGANHHTSCYVTPSVKQMETTAFQTTQPILTTTVPTFKTETHRSNHRQGLSQPCRCTFWVIARV
jgi:phospholipase C